MELAVRLLVMCCLVLVPACVPEVADESIVNTRVFVYASDAANGNVFIVDLDQVTGAMTLVGSASGPSAPIELVATPDGRFLYVASSGTPSIYQYGIDAVSGNLTPLSPAEISNGTSLSYLQMHASGEWLLVGDYDGAAVDSYSVNQSTGQLALGDSGTVWGNVVGPVQVVLNGNYVAYLVQTSPISVQLDQFLPASGNFINIDTSPATGGSINSGTLTYGVHASYLDGAFLFVSNLSSTTIDVFRASTSDVTVWVTTAAATVGEGLLHHPSLPVLYGASVGALNVYSVDSSGTMTQLQNYSVALAGTKPASAPMGSI